jgi:hypothetical protein
MFCFIVDLLRSALWVKQRCLSDDFIAINDKLERFARVLHARWNGGERELDSGETERESVWEAEHSVKEGVASVQSLTF